ncbi:MAG: metal-dependent hydrolase, partial [Myxococcota bacterium]
MDNLTHALAGCLAAEVLVSVRRRTRSRAQEPERWATTAYVLSAVANNLPDLDILYLGITEGKIGYLVHHRGHTHTLVVAALLGLLSWAMVWAGRHRLAREERPWSARDGGDLLLLAVGGTFLHMAMDFTNNYGVHPFWPVDRRWFYGDTIFIVEPMLWASVAPVLFFSVSHRAARVLFGSLSVLGVVATWASGFVAWPLAIGVTGWTALVGAAAAGARPGRRVVVALAACV